MRDNSKQLKRYAEELNKTQLTVHEKIKILQDSGFTQNGVARIFGVGYTVVKRIKDDKDWSDFLYMTSKVKLQKNFSFEEKRMFLEIFPQNTHVQILECLLLPMQPYGAREIIIAKYVARKHGNHIPKNSSATYDRITAEINDLRKEGYVRADSKLRQYHLTYEISESGRKIYNRMKTVYERAKVN